MKRLICRFKGHKYKSTGKVMEGGLYYKNQLQMPNKEYKCERCGYTTVGCGLEEEEHKKMMKMAQLATAQHMYDMSRLPERIERLERLFKEQNDRSEVDA